jgi:hypothetical protein
MFTLLFSKLKFRIRTKISGFEFILGVNFVSVN